jgi:hypothetical protein
MAILEILELEMTRYPGHVVSPQKYGGSARWLLLAAFVLAAPGAAPLPGQSAAP